MENGYSRKLLDLINPEEKINWFVRKDDLDNVEGDEKKLELRLGPPSVEDWSVLDADKNYNSAHKVAQKRSAPAPVVGWPPIRSFRKNIASSSSKAAHSQNGDASNDIVKEEKIVESCQKGFFVKINMKGVPIGRKVDLNAYDSYQKLSVAVDQLFRGLLAVQNDKFGGGDDEEKAISGLVDGNGEYTLVYEDNEGDRMLVGDVPWHMFVSSVKRLRVIKSSELSNMCRLGSDKEKKH